MEMNFRNLNCIFNELYRIIHMSKPSKFLEYASAWHINTEYGVTQRDFVRQLYLT